MEGFASAPTAAEDAVADMAGAGCPFAMAGVAA